MNEEVQAELLQWIDALASGEGVIITRNDRPVAQLIGLPIEKQHPFAGRGRGKLVILGDDDDLPASRAGLIRRLKC